MLGRLAVPKIIYVRLVGSPENTANIGQNPNINNLAWSPRPSPEPPCRFFVQKIIYGTFSGLNICGKRAVKQTRCFSQHNHQDFSREKKRIQAVEESGETCGLSIAHFAQHGRGRRTPSPNEGVSGASSVQGLCACLLHRLSVLRCDVCAFIRYL